MITPDTSVVLPLLAPWHELHDAARRTLTAGDPARALVGHVAVECIAALGRLPRGHRVAPAAVLLGLERSFPTPWLTLDGAELRDALGTMVATGIRGGATYDGLVGLTAARHGAVLITADRRALPTYELLGVDVTLVS